MSFLPETKISDSFSSRFHCKCQTTLPTDIADNTCVLNCCFDEYKDKPGNNIIDLNDKELDKNSIQQNFHYHQKHEFHKLSQNLKRNNTFSILHTNICSINANTENLELLLNNLERGALYLTVVPVITGKNNKELGLLIIKNGISIFRNLQKEFFCLFLTLARFLKHFKDF